MVKFLSVILSLIAFTQISAADKPSTSTLEVSALTATVKAIDYPARLVTLQASDGNEMTMRVGEFAHNFHQVKVGDEVHFTYKEAMAIDVRKADGELKKEADISVARAALGDSPAGVITGTYEISARVEKIDYANRKVTLKGPEGRTVSFKVSDKVKRFNEVKQGDHVVVQYTEALAVSVTTPGK